MILTLQIQLANADFGELDIQTRQLREELLLLDLDRVTLRR